MDRARSDGALPARVIGIDRSFARMLDCFVWLDKNRVYCVENYEINGERVGSWSLLKKYDRRYLRDFF